MVYCRLFKETFVSAGTMNISPLPKATSKDAYERFRYEYIPRLDSVFCDTQQSTVDPAIAGSATMSSEATEIHKSLAYGDVSALSLIHI